MSLFTVLIADGLDETGQAILRSEASLEDRTGISPEELMRAIEKYEAMIVRSRTKVTAQLLAQTDRLKVIGRVGVGVDNIDLGAAAARGVTVVNAPQSTSLAVAELTVGLLLSLAREIPRADAGMKAGTWLKPELMGVELNGKTLGILGIGRIGMLVAQRASALGMRVLGYDPLLPHEEIRQRGADPVDLDGLYAQADFITLHLPLNDETRGILDVTTLNKMKPGVRLVCAARGGVVQETALLAALESGQVGGAALDVFEHEPPSLTALVGHPRVIASPHIGAQTREAQARAAVDIASEVLAALHGEPLRWKVI